MVDVTPVPGPLSLPLLGNALSLMNEEAPILGFERLADVYGPIYQLTIKGRRIIVVSSAELLEELVDEKRFQKMPPLALSDDDGAKGLFAAATDDPDWGQAHRILSQPMGPLSVDAMFDDMKDIVNQLMLKWARKGSEDRVLLTDDFTRLTLDTIALCTMKYRFNSFYSKEMHPFVDAMLNVLYESGSRTTRPALISALLYSRNVKFLEDEAILKKTAQQIIENRRANPTEEKDLLNAMIYGKDPKSGEVMRDELIAAQMTTFLIAGHETTSGLLSFTFLYLLKNRQAYVKAQEEVDNVLGENAICPADLKRLKYLDACMRESIRLSPTAPILSKQINPATHQDSIILGGRYEIKSTDRVLVLLGKTQRDTRVYGEDAAEFKPERMLDEGFNKLPNGAWKPFGNGVRSCIGRSFAWQEALLVAALTLQNFDLSLEDPAYQLQIKQTLTIKPDNLFVRTKLREGIDATVLDHKLHGDDEKMNEPPTARSSNRQPVTSASGKLKPMTILYGSNTGTCQAFAQRLGSDAISRGFDAAILDMDSATGKIPKTQPVIIITPSYEGQPPNNGAKFFAWLQTETGNHLEGVEFAVCGCGHKDWAKTFHLIPKSAEKLMADAGARRIASIGLIDVAKGNAFGDFEDWEDEVLWPQLTSSNDEITPHNSSVNAEISTNTRASSLRHDVSVGTVVDNKILTAAGEPIKRHMEVQLPENCTYECGDYLAILPMNSSRSVRRVMALFKLPQDATITFKEKGNGPSIIPNNIPLSIYDVLRSYVELSQTATKKALKVCAMHASSADDRNYLEKTSLDHSLFNKEITDKRVCVFDILHHRPSISLPFPTFLSLLPPLRPRQYSISSSPLLNPKTCTITYGHIQQPALCNPNMLFEGVTSTYLSSLTQGDRLQISVHPTAKKTFRLPADDQGTPMLMFAAGTGLAPFRGFLQQRAINITKNPEKKLAKAVLFLGCRSKASDRLYADEMDRWIRDGVVDVRYAFSQEPEHSEKCKYVMERMERDADIIVQLWREGARVYVCGSQVFDKMVGEAARAIAIKHNPDLSQYEEGMHGKGVDAWFASVASERIAADVFD